MSRVRAFLAFVWEFVVGDDWRIAVGVLIGLGLTALIGDTTVAAWWILPLAVALMLGTSVWRAAAPRR